MQTQKLNTKRIILVGFAFFLISAFWQAYDAIVPLVLTNHFGLNQFFSGAVMSLDNILALFMLPLFGAISDKFNSRFGKRTPFIFIGTIVAIVAFVLLTFIDNAQLAPVFESAITESYADASTLRDEAYDIMKEGRKLDNPELIEKAEMMLKNADELFEQIRLETLAITKQNALYFIGFIGTLLLLLIAMATFRSPAVALMPDVTIKPLRSKGNAVINLMGTAGGILVLLLGKILHTSEIYMQYTWYVVAVCAIMLIGLLIFIFTVKENKWAKEMQEETERLNIARTGDAEPKEKRKLTKAEKQSLILILASVALWYIGYNSITSKYSVYASNELGFDYNLTLIIAQAAAVVAYIPVGIVSSKFGRRKTILAGIVMLASAFFLGNFITPAIPESLMYPIFILAGIGWATINVNSFPMVVELARGGEVGKYTGYYYTASMAAQIVAPVLSGLLYVIFTMRVTFFLFGTVFVAASFLTMFFVKHGNAQDLGGKTAKELISDNFANDD